MSLHHSFQRIATELGMDPVNARFFPYSELKHTWRYDGSQWEFKVSDYLESAPEEVIDSLVWHLLSRASALRCPDGRASPYIEYVRSPELWREAGPKYLARAKTLSMEPMGKHRDLQTVFDYVNSTYFSGGLKAPALSWTSESPRRRLGYYFEQLDLLAVNRALDSESVPRYVLEFVMYHELLHHADRRGRSHRTVRHTKAFRERERAFSTYSEAEAWLRRIVAQARRKRG
ncbi:MAG: hypothetical protein A3K76_05050 [Euryarchaeota archaeon RBG_13_57_23]|nr:MAG: hypothetical protein A3K76_05050 [Euryarchaeota archaeon RBG_13_57_23]